MKLREAVEDMEVLDLREGLWTFSEEEETLGLRGRSRKALEWVTVFTSVIKAAVGRSNRSHGRSESAVKPLAVNESGSWREGGSKAGFQVFIIAPSLHLGNWMNWIGFRFRLILGIITLVLLTHLYPNPRKTWNLTQLLNINTLGLPINPNTTLIIASFKRGVLSFFLFFFSQLVFLFFELLLLSF